MAHEVFICYSSKNEQVADAVCAALERQNIACWIAHRDVLPGAEYPVAVMEGISNCKVVVFIFSKAADSSPQVKREIERAVSMDKKFVTLRIENVQPSSGLIFLLSLVQWLDAFTPPLTRHLPRLCESVLRLLGRPAASEPTPQRPDPVVQSTSMQARPGSIKWPRKLLIGVGALVAALVVMGWVAGMSSYAWASFFIGLAFFAGALWATVNDWFHKGSWASGAWAVLWAVGWLSISFFANIPVIMVVGAYAGKIHMAEWIVGEEYSTGDSGWSGLHLPGLAPNPAKAEYFLSRACAGGYSEGCVSLGYAYDKGLGVKQDAPTSAGFYQKACTGGNVTGCYDLGFAYESGDGVAVNFAQAASLYKLACDGGRFDACNNLGVLYERGHGVGKDPSTAAVLYKKACDSGDAHGCNNLGVLYERGGVGMDLYQAPALYKKACDNGDPDGCGNLGNLIWYGTGIAQDKANGRELLQKGCNMSSKWSCDRLKELQ
jgi:TPR repeat protein